MVSIKENIGVKNIKRNKDMQATRHTGIIRLVIACALAAITAMPASAQEVAEVWLDKVAEKLRNKGVETSFRINEENIRASGKLLMEGEKFAYITEEMRIWYDGTAQWTLQTGNGYSELYINNPTLEEQQAINPYLLLSNYKESFTATDGGARSLNGKPVHLVQLQANDKSAEIKTVDLYITRDSTLAAIVFAAANGQSYQIEIRSMRSGLTFPKGTFTYQPDNYPADEVIDLR